MFIKIGSLLKQHKHLLPNHPYKKLIILAIALIFVASSLCNGLSAVGARMYNNIILLMLSAISGTIVVLYIAECIAKITSSSLRTCISYIAKNSLPIFMLNGLFVCFAQYNNLPFMDNIDFLPAIKYSVPSIAFALISIPFYEMVSTFLDAKLAPLYTYIAQIWNKKIIYQNT